MTMTDRPTYQHPTLGAIRRGDEITFKLRDMYAPAVAHVSTVYDNAVSANGWFVDSDHILAVRRYEPEGAHRAEWRPIDGAPRDGSWVLLRGGTNGNAPCPPCVYACPADGEWVYAYCNRAWRSSHDDPTHYLANVPEAPDA